MRIAVEHDRFDASQEPFGLAWALQSPYTDIEGSKFYGEILWLAQRSITAGCASTRFCPDGSLTRGQMAKSLAEALDLPSTGTDFYSDDESSRFEGAINRLTAAGLTGGCGGRQVLPRPHASAAAGWPLPWPGPCTCPAPAPTSSATTRAARTKPTSTASRLPASAAAAPTTATAPISG